MVVVVFVFVFLPTIYPACDDYEVCCDFFQECETSLKEKTELIGRMEGKAADMTDSIRKLETKYVFNKEEVLLGAAGDSSRKGKEEEEEEEDSAEGKTDGPKELEIRTQVCPTNDASKIDTSSVTPESLETAQMSDVIGGEVTPAKVSPSNADKNVFPTKSTN